MARACAARPAARVVERRAWMTHGSWRTVRHHLHAPTVGVEHEEASFLLLPGDPDRRGSARERRRGSSRGRARSRCGRAPVRRPARARGSTARRRRRAGPGHRRGRGRAGRTGPTSARPPPRRRRRAGRRGRCGEARSRHSALGDHPLGLVLGNRERDVERVGRDLHLLAGAGEVDVPLLDRVGQPPDPEISTSTTSPGCIGREFAGVPGEEHVARLERDQPAEVGELVGDGEEQVVRRRLLDDLAVEVRAQRVARSGRTRRRERARGRAGGSRPGPSRAASRRGRRGGSRACRRRWRTCSRRRKSSASSIGTPFIRRPTTTASSPS